MLILLLFHSAYFYCMKKLSLVLIYLFVICLYTIFFIKQNPSVSLLASNELGDFLAGVFAPLAFMFLYLGYKQQQHGLSQNTDVLKLQLRELQENIKQQKLMQEHAEENLTILKSKIEAENKKELILFQPFFHLTWKQFTPIENTDSLNFELEILNSGKAVRNVHIRVAKLSGHGFYTELTSVFKSNEVHKTSIPIRHPDDFSEELDEDYIQGYSEDKRLIVTIKIEYLDELYNENYQLFKSRIYKKIERTGFIISRFELIEKNF